MAAIRASRAVQYMERAKKFKALWREVKAERDAEMSDNARLRWLAGWLCQCEELCHWYDYFRCHPMMYDQVNWRQVAHIEAYATRHQAFEDIRAALEGRPDFEMDSAALAQPEKGGV